MKLIPSCTWAGWGGPEEEEGLAWPSGMKEQGAGRGCWSLGPVGMQAWTEGAVIQKTSRSSKGWIVKASNAS